MDTMLSTIEKKNTGKKHNHYKTDEWYSNFSDFKSNYSGKGC